jgi:hypothetical protein
MRTHGRFVATASLLCFYALAVSMCASKPAATAAMPADLTPYVSVKELMENMIDPQADNIFDAVVTDISLTGIVETKPVTDEDWATVRQGAVTLLEGTNLLKIPRRVAPPGDTNKSIGPNAPELSPEQIQTKIDQDRPLWNAKANDLRDHALKVLDIVKARDADALFRAGSEIDKSCENCHLEYWYPGDRKAVLEDEAKRATMPSKPKP